MENQGKESDKSFSCNHENCASKTSRTVERIVENHAPTLFFLFKSNNNKIPEIQGSSKMPKNKDVKLMFSYSLQI